MCTYLFDFNYNLHGENMRTWEYVTLEHKTSLKCTFFKIEIYASSESWISNISIDVWFGQYFKIWNLNIEKIIFKVVLSNAYYTQFFTGNK